MSAVESSRTPQERTAGKASDVEQAVGHGGNLRDGAAPTDAPQPDESQVAGSSGHVPQLEEVNPAAFTERSGSSGADADRNAAGSAR